MGCSINYFIVSLMIPFSFVLLHQLLCALLNQVRWCKGGAQRREIQGTSAYNDSFIIGLSLEIPIKLSQRLCLAQVCDLGREFSLQSWRIFPGVLAAVGFSWQCFCTDVWLLPCLV